MAWRWTLLFIFTLFLKPVSMRLSLERPIALYQCCGPRRRGRNLMFLWYTRIVRHSSARCVSLTHSLAKIFSSRSFPSDIWATWYAIACQALAWYPPHSQAEAVATPPRPTHSLKVRPESGNGFSRRMRRVPLEAWQAKRGYHICRKQQGKRA